MTAVTLFDVMREAETAGNAAGEKPRLRTPAFAERMVTALRDEYQRLLAYERDFDLRDLDQERELHILRTIWRAFDSWSEEVERVMARVDALGPAGRNIPGYFELVDRYYVTRARLSITPESQLLARNQARRGEVVSAKELRDELRARLRG